MGYEFAPNGDTLESGETRGRDYSRAKRVGAAALTALVFVGGGVVGYHKMKAEANPDCYGQQTIPVEQGDTTWDIAEDVPTKGSVTTANVVKAIRSMNAEKDIGSLSVNDSLQVPEYCQEQGLDHEIH